MLVEEALNFKYLSGDMGTTTHPEAMRQYCEYNAR